MIPESDLEAIRKGFDLYQYYAQKSSIYPTVVLYDNGKDISWVYPALGLSGEVGELNEKLKKVMRDKDGNISEEDKRLIMKELGDVSWYASAIGLELDIKFGDVAVANLEKTLDRLDRGVVQGSGDER